MQREQAKAVALNQIFSIDIYDTWNFMTVDKYFAPTKPNDFDLYVCAFAFVFKHMINPAPS